MWPRAAHGLVRQPRGSDITGTQSSERNLLDCHHPYMMKASADITVKSRSFTLKVETDKQVDKKQSTDGSYLLQPS